MSIVKRPQLVSRALREPWTGRDEDACEKIEQRWLPAIRQGKWWESFWVFLGSPLALGSVIKQMWLCVCVRTLWFCSRALLLSDASQHSLPVRGGNSGVLEKKKNWIRGEKKRQRGRNIDSFWEGVRRLRLSNNHKPTGSENRQTEWINQCVHATWALLFHRQRVVEETSPSLSFSIISSPWQEILTGTKQVFMGSLSFVCVCVCTKKTTNAPPCAALRCQHQCL